MSNTQEFSGARPLQPRGAAQTAVAEVPAAKRQMEYLPVGFFGSVMGLTGLSVAWHLAHEHYRVPSWISSFIGAIAVAEFIAIGIGYITKLITAPDAVLDEFRHPIAGNLFGRIPISLLLLPIVIAPVSLDLTRGC